MSKKDLNTRDFLPKSIISAVTLKHKCLGTHLVGGNTDEDSHYGGGGGVGEDRGVQETVKGEHTILKIEKGCERKGRVKAKTTKGKGSLVGGEEAEAKMREGTGTRSSQRGSRQTATLPISSSQFCPNSFPYSHHEVHTTYAKSPSLTNPPSHLTHSLARGHPTIPSLISPTRPLILCQGPTCQWNQLSDWNQSASAHYRKTIRGWMNLDLEQGRNEDRGWTADRVEIIRITEGTPGPKSLPHHAQEVLSLSSFSSGWIDQRSVGHSNVLLRRSALHLQDKMRTWRRHTLVV